VTLVIDRHEKLARQPQDETTIGTTPNAFDCTQRILQ